MRCGQVSRSSFEMSIPKSSLGNGRAQCVVANEVLVLENRQYVG